MRLKQLAGYVNFLEKHWFMKNDCQQIESNLLFILNEIFAQPEIAKYFPPEMQSYDE